MESSSLFATGGFCLASRVMLSLGILIWHIQGDFRCRASDSSAVYYRAPPHEQPRLSERPCLVDIHADVRFADLSPVVRHTDLWLPRYSHSV